jgi:hypothetical protein
MRKILMPGLSFDHRESEIAARVGLYRTDTSVLSFQTGLRSPGFSVADSLEPFDMRRAASLDVRGPVGRRARRRTESLSACTRPC